MPGLLLPVASYSGVSSWYNHTRRSPRSSEPGTDLYVPIGTHILAPADGYIWGSGESIAPATGRWVGINFDNGMSFRSLHHSRNRITTGRVSRGDVIAFSGASGYGEEDWSWNVAETGGAHTHVTLWPTHEHRFGYRADGSPYTIDFMEHVDGLTAGGGSTTFTPTTEDDDMYDDKARSELVSLIRTEARPIKLYQHGTGIIAVGPGGKVWGIPSEAYLILLDAVGIAGPSVLRAIGDDELGFIQQLLGQLAPDPGVTAQIDAVLKISEEDAKRIADAVDAQRIADAVNDEADQRARERLG